MEAEVFAAVHAVAALVAGTFVVGIEGEGLPVPLGRLCYGGMQGAERGRRFETEFGDEARGILFVVLVGGHFTMPYCDLCQGSQT